MLYTFNIKIFYLASFNDLKIHRIIVPSELVLELTCDVIKWCFIVTPNRLHHAAVNGTLVEASASIVNPDGLGEITVSGASSNPADADHAVGWPTGIVADISSGLLFYMQSYYLTLENLN